MGNQLQLINLVISYNVSIYHEPITIILYDKGRLQKYHK